MLPWYIIKLLNHCLLLRSAEVSNMAYGPLVFLVRFNSLS